MSLSNSKPGQQPRILSFSPLPPVVHDRHSRLSAHSSSGSPSSPSLSLSLSLARSRNYFPVASKPNPFYHGTPLSLLASLPKTSSCHHTLLRRLFVSIPHNSIRCFSSASAASAASNTAITFIPLLFVVSRLRRSCPTENRKSSRPSLSSNTHTHRLYVQSTRLCPLFPSGCFSPFCPASSSSASSSRSRSIAGPPHTVILFHYFLIERLLLLFDCSFYPPSWVEERRLPRRSTSHVHLVIFPFLCLGTGRLAASSSASGVVLHLRRLHAPAFL